MRPSSRWLNRGRVATDVQMAYMVREGADFSVILRAEKKPSGEDLLARLCNHRCQPGGFPSPDLLRLKAAGLAALSYTHNLSHHAAALRARAWCGRARLLHYGSLHRCGFSWSCLPNEFARGIVCRQRRVPSPARAFLLLVVRAVAHAVRLISLVAF